MIDAACSSDFAAPGRAAPGRPYRDSALPAAGSAVTIRLKECLDRSCRRQLQDVVGQWCTVSPVVAFAAVAHVDLAEVTHLDPAGIDLLNEAYARLTAAGWLFRVTPPADPGARLAFLFAATGGRLRWA